MDNDHAALSRLLPVLPILVELGASRHVTATAEVLGIPQSTVSRALSRAADVVGTPLVVRSGRGVELTPAALALIPQLAEALEHVREGLALARQETGRSFGRVGVAFQHTFGEAVMPLLISRFSHENPGVSFDLQQGSRAFCLDLLATGAADVALVSPPAAPGRATGSETLYSEPLKLLVPDGHRLAGGAPVRLDEVRDEGFIMFEPGYGMRSIVEGLCRAAGFRPRTAFEGQDVHTVRGLVSAGLGVAVAPASTTAATPAVLSAGTQPEGPERPVPGGRSGTAAAGPGDRSVAVGPGDRSGAAAEPVMPRQGGLGWAEVDISWPPARREIGLVWHERPGAPPQAARFRAMVLAEGRELLGRVAPESPTREAPESSRRVAPESPTREGRTPAGT